MPGDQKIVTFYTCTVQRSLQCCTNLHFEPFLKGREQIVIILEENYDKKEIDQTAIASCNF